MKMRPLFVCVMCQNIKIRKVRQVLHSFAWKMPFYNVFKVDSLSWESQKNFGPKSVVWSLMLPYKRRGRGSIRNRGEGKKKKGE